MSRRIANYLFIATLLAGLAACGDSTQIKPKSGGASPQAKKSAAAASLAAATAAEVAEERRGKVRCPAKIKSSARAQNAPIDDVVGVRPGMSYEEAANVVMCTHDLMVTQEETSRRFNIQTYGRTLRQGFSARFAEPRVERTSKQIMRDMQADFMARSTNAARQDMQPGQSKWYVSTMGMPGEERVIAAAREEWFEEGRHPTIASVEQALLKKYGTPTRNQQSGDIKHMTWAYDPFGRLITETSPLFNRCHANADPDAGSNFSPDCGVVVAAAAHPTRENPGLARYLQVSVIDQASGYEALTGTEQRLQQMESERKAKELEAAAKNADAPQL